jgi:hypothetical protein
MHLIEGRTVKWPLFMILVTIVTMFLTNATVPNPHNQIAQAFPCVGDGSKEYCAGYRDGAIQAKEDYRAGNDLNSDQHACSHNSTKYCSGYNKGYNDEANFLG